MTDRPDNRPERPQSSGDTLIGVIRDPEPTQLEGRIQDPGKLSGAFNAAISALDSGQKRESERRFDEFSKDLKASVANAYEKGGIGAAEKFISQVDKGVVGEGTGLYGAYDQRNQKVILTNIRPVNPTIAAVLDKARPSGEAFVNLDGKWYETLGKKTEVDLKELNQDAEKKAEFEKSTGKPLEQTAKELAASILSDLKKYADRGVSERVMNELDRLVSGGGKMLESAIMQELKDSGYRVQLEHKAGLGGIHGNTVRQNTVEISGPKGLIAKTVKQRDTARGLGGPRLDPDQSVGVFKD